MATDLLSAGIRKFEEDGDKLKSMIRKIIEEVTAGEAQKEMVPEDKKE